jgi:hypothetical protein
MSFLQANLLVCTSSITKDPCRASQLAQPLSDANFVAPLPLPECQNPAVSSQTHNPSENFSIGSKIFFLIF